MQVCIQGLCRARETHPGLALITNKRTNNNNNKPSQAKEYSNHPKMHPKAKPGYCCNLYTSASEENGAEKSAGIAASLAHLAG